MQTATQPTESDSSGATRPTIAAVCESDLEAMVALLNREIAGGVAHFGSQPLQLEAFRAQWHDLRGRFPWRIARLGDTPCGFAKSSPWKARDGYNWTAEISVYVAPAAQGRRVGTYLYEALFPALQRAGYRTLLAGIVLPNPASVALHEAMGMVHAGTLPRNGFKRGAWHDVGYWTLHFGDGQPPAG